MKNIFIIILLLINCNAYASLQKGIDGHKKGEIIALNKDEQIADWCEFDKQIVVTKANVLCVYNGSTK